jgi:hypothetical protein
MNSIRTAPAVTPGAPADTPVDPNLATCPMCHTAHPSLTRAAVDAGEGWRCSRCAQVWDQGRLSAVAAYARWVFDREQVSAPEQVSTAEMVATAAPHLRIVPRSE